MGSLDVLALARVVHEAVTPGDASPMLPPCTTWGVEWLVTAGGDGRFGATGATGAAAGTVAAVCEGTSQ